MDRDFDAIIVGARCGGAPIATLLARKGYKVLLLDRAKFPSDIAHGHLIHKGGPRCLKAWGLLDKVLATGCPAVTEMTLDADGVSLTGRGLMVDGVPVACGPRRSALDKTLVDAAVEAGAELRVGFVVEEYSGDGTRISGIRGREWPGGRVSSERATVTIGADGRGSLLARTVQATEYEVEPTLACYYFSYWSGVAGESLEIYARANRAIFAFPTNDGLFAIFIAWPIGEHREVQSDLETQFLRALDLAPGLAERVRGGRRVERFYGAANLPNFLRKPYGPGWALVGDAGCHKDPYLALGICDAFRDVDLLAESLDLGLSGKAPLVKATAKYERRRNEATMADYKRNIAMAKFQPAPPDERALFVALVGNQEATDLFFKARAGMVPCETFFNQENLRRIMNSATCDVSHSVATGDCGVIGECHSRPTISSRRSTAG
jgi:flavin-dependent dehydrogenase